MGPWPGNLGRQSGFLMFSGRELGTPGPPGCWLGTLGAPSLLIRGPEAPRLQLGVPWPPGRQ